MIPASYLFKDVFQKTWYDPDIEAAIERQKPRGHGVISWLSRLARALRRNTPAPDLSETSPASLRR